MTISIIAAIGRNREIGANNELLWHLPADMAFFKETTREHHVIMGRRNYESIPLRYRPLPNRINVVITHDADYQAAECYVCTTIEEALQIARDNEEDEAFIIGGGQIYAWALRDKLVDKMYITHVEGDFPEADTFFPVIDEQEWKVSEWMQQQESVSNGYSFCVKVYEKPVVASDVHAEGEGE